MLISSVSSQLPLIWLLSVTTASVTPSPLGLFRTLPITENPMTRNIGWETKQEKQVRNQVKLLSKTNCFIPPPICFPLKMTTSIWTLHVNFNTVQTKLSIKVLSHVSEQVIALRNSPPTLNCCVLLWNPYEKEQRQKWFSLLCNMGPTVQEETR